ncbi:MAG: class I SAM-dependent methyltransferase [Planctomycetes bacterium]|nr:class I SAM-dependent methyltransferase [Planctomycetota bacterium]
MKPSTDEEWEKFGKDDPYFGVVSCDQFRKSSLTDAGREEFFRSGQRHIDEVFAKIRTHLDPGFAPKRALDFGCGVGRLVLPLAGMVGEVTGVDISESMLAEARRNCASRSVGNATFVTSDDRLSQVTGTYDLVHTYIVLQHIPVQRGMRILERLVALLADGGVGVVHLTYAKAYANRRFIQFAKKHIPLAVNLINLVKGRRFSAPHMQMNTYHLNQVFLAIQRSGAVGCHSEFTDHGGELGVTVYFRKPKLPS